MKKLILFSIPLLTLLTACQTGVDQTIPSLRQTYDVVFLASIEEPVQPAEPVTKVYADGSMKVLWNVDDRITIFNKYTYGAQYCFNGRDGDNAGVFSLVGSGDFVTGNEIEHIYAVYPYSTATSVSNEGILTIDLPNHQTYKPDSFGIGANTMVSLTDDTQLRFRNVGGYLSIKLYGEGVSVSKLYLKGNCGETLSGTATVTMNVGGTPSLSLAGKPSPDILELTCISPVPLGATTVDYTEFWFVVPPLTFTEGFTVTVIDSHGGTFEKSTTQPVTISRNAISRMAPIEVDIDYGGYFSPYADSLKIELVKPKDVNASAAWTKFIFLMGSYRDDEFPGSMASPKNKVVTVNATEDSVTVLVRQDMKDFILGAAGNGEGSQIYDYVENGVPKTLHADYGLLGIFDILSRDNVVGESPAPTSREIANAKRAMDQAGEKWAEDRQILVDGFAHFEPFCHAEEALRNEYSVSCSRAAALLQSIDNLRNRILSICIHISSFDGNDSLYLFTAIKDFVTARENYLDFVTSVRKIDPQDPTKRDSSVFYYSNGKSGAGKPILASKKFSELTYQELLAGEYEYCTDNPGDIKIAEGAPDSVVNAFANIIDQLGSELYSMFDFDNNRIVEPVVTDLSTALYGKYKIDRWEEPSIILTVDGSVYKPASLRQAERNFVDSVNAYIVAYNRFWGVNVARLDIFTSPVAEYLVAMESGDARNIAEAKRTLVRYINDQCSTATLDPRCFTLDTFKPYENGAPVVYFQNGAIVPTAALSAILNAVDPKAKDKGDAYMIGKIVENESAIFNKGATDFYNYMRAASLYYDMVNTKPSQNLTLIRTEIKKVEDALQYDAIRLQSGQ